MTLLDLWCDADHYNDEALQLTILELSSRLDATYLIGVPAACLPADLRAELGRSAVAVPSGAVNS